MKSINGFNIHFAGFLLYSIFVLWQGLTPGWTVFGGVLGIVLIENIQADCWGEVEGIDSPVMRQIKWFGQLDTWTDIVAGLIGVAIPIAIKLFYNL